MNAWPAAFASGLLFGVGLLVSGMTQPEKVIAFLDVAGGRWDPTLAFVMIGGIGVHATLSRLVMRSRTQLYSLECDATATDAIDHKLLLGSAIFGVGWGLAGYCPGPSLVSAASGSTAALAFVAAMVAGMWIQHRPR